MSADIFEYSPDDEARDERAAERRERRRRERQSAVTSRTENAPANWNDNTEGEDDDE